MSESEPGPVGVRPRILVGVDGSADGLRAVMYAMRHAMADGADVWVVHVVDDEAPVGGLWELVSTPTGLRKLGQAKLDEAVGVLSAEGFPSERVVAELLDGRPGDVLVNLSERAELMVTGRRSISGLARLFVGSTSVEAAAHASCPVVVISAASTPQRTGGLQSVAVAVSSWPAHQAALEWGLREAVLRKARLRVIHVVPQTLGIEGAAFMAAAASGLDSQLLPLLQRHPETSVEVEVMLGDPVDALVAVTKTVDLLILGTSDAPVLGGSIRGVMAHSHCPVGVTR